MSDEVVQTPFGKFLVNPDECIGATLKAGTLWDGPGFLQVIGREYGRLGERGRTVLDIGAHLGDWTVWMAAAGAWRVIAVEPAPVMISYLKSNLDLNKGVCADRVILLPVAAYSHRTVLRWAVPYDTRDTGGAALVRVDPALAYCAEDEILARPLDDYQHLFGTTVSLVKIDAQGSDLRAIFGLARTIQRDRPVIVFEWEAELAAAHGDTLEECLRCLTSWGYAVHEWPTHKNNYLALPKEKETR